MLHAPATDAAGNTSTASSVTAPDIDGGDTTPPDAPVDLVIGLAGSIFNMFGNIAGIVTPIVIGYIVYETHSFNGSLVSVRANAQLAVFSYLVIVGKIERLKLKPV